MKIQFRDLEKYTCLEMHSISNSNQEHSEPEQKDVGNLQTVLFILKLKATRLTRQLEEVTTVNKYLNHELEGKSEILVAANIKISTLNNQLQQKDYLVRELDIKYKHLQETVGNRDPGELKILILKLQKYEELISKSQGKSSIQYDSEASRSEIKRLNELINTLQVLNSYNKQSLQKELDHRKIMECEINKQQSVIETLSATNKKLLYEKDWNKARRKSLIYKQEELMRKNASLQEYSDNLREKYEALLLQKKRKKRKKGNELETQKTKTEEPNENEKYHINENEQHITLSNETKKYYISEGKQEMSELDTGIFRAKEISVKNYNEEKEKVSKLKEKLECMTMEISILQEEKDNFENSLRTSEENYTRLKACFDKLAVAHKNLIDFKNEEQMKINERIIKLNERLDSLGKILVER
ncbi:putative leucine-rich repeat-containing protein DDB_G0290503 [Halyomorpha halys]|uniref:putative leucine-rich repeat-containing protein DDB_G0290503 n=1 Tax=Halyomorpha halys TaxID=286706 RepID=UPI0006D50422|nr:kelch repeat-containing protein 1-like [Halyomorpha halys]